MADAAPTSTTTPAPETGADTTTTVTTTDAPEGDLPEAIKAILAKERKAAADAVKAQKAAERALTQQQQATMTEQERAVAVAKAEGRTEALRELGVTRAADAVRLLAAGRPIDIEALIEGVDLSRYVGEDGEPDRKALEAWLDRVAPKATEQTTTPTFPDLGQGSRTNSTLALNGDPLLNAVKNKLGIPAGR